MGAVILTGAAARPHYGHDGGLPVTNEPRILIHWDGTANRKQNSNLADGVVWVDAQQLIRYGSLNMGIQFHSLNSGANIAIAGSMSPGSLAGKLPNLTAAEITAIDANFAAISAGLATGLVATTTTIYTLLKITFATGSSASLSITSM